MNPVIKFCALLFIATACLLSSTSYFNKLFNNPITDIKLEGNLSSSNSYVVRNKIEQLIKDEYFFNIDLTKIHEQLVYLPQVASLNIRKIWPNILVVQVVEQTPVAKWGENQFLNNRGQIFDIERDAEHLDVKDLPKLTGDNSMQEAVMKQYRLFSSLLNPFKFTVMELNLKGYSSWQLKVKSKFGNMINLMVGSGQIIQKIERFGLWYNKLSQNEIIQIKQVDLRYSNALAVSWKKV